MGENSKIEWTDHTWNPWWGCVNISPACDHCYAEMLAKRFGFKIWGKDSPRRFFGAKHWTEPVRWNVAAERDGIRRRVFCASMADVMEDRRDLDEARSDLFALIESTPSLDWLLLTKRPQNFGRLLPPSWLKNPRPNVWAMATVESPEYFWRIAELQAVPAVVRGLSIEPLLAPMPTLADHLTGIAWVIVGGESGGRARPMGAAWVRSIRDACQQTGTAFHFKQWGEYSENLVHIGKKSAGRLLDGREWNEFPMPGADDVRKLLQELER